MSIDNMESKKMNSRFIGVLFISVLVTWFIGYALIESVIAVPDYLNTIHIYKNKVLLGAFFELIEAAGVVGVAVILYPVLKGYNKNSAKGYLAFRIIEAVILIVITLSSLLLVTLSQVYSTALSPDTETYKTVGALLFAIRMDWSQMIVALFFSFGAMILYYVLYKTKLVPAIISVWGLIAGVLVFLNQLVLVFSGKNLGVFLGLPMLLNELVLGIWLITKGFNVSLTDSVSSN